jgi:hypothetical protein
LPVPDFSVNEQLEPEPKPNPLTPGFTGTYSAEDAPVVRMNGGEFLLLLHVETGDCEQQGEQPRVHACAKSTTIWTMNMF